MNKFSPVKMLAGVLGAIFCLCYTSRASVTINYELGEITSGGVNVSTGTVFFISHGADNVLNSLNWSSGSSFILGDDKLFGAVPILSGVAAGAMASYALPTGTVANTTKFSAIFVKSMTSSIVDYTTGVLNNGATFGASGGTSYAFGTYRTDSIEAFGGDPTGNMAWIFPADGATLQLSAYSGTGPYTGQDITASLVTSSNLIVIPEPSSFALSLLGISVLATISRKRKTA